MNAAPPPAPGPGPLRLATLTAVGAALALTLALRILSDTLRAHATARTALARAEAVCATEPARRAELARAGVTPGGGRTGAAWLAAAEAHARACGLAAEASSPLVERRGPVERHRVRLHLRATGLEPLLAFDERLRRDAESGVGGADRLLLESRETDGALSATYEITLCLLAE